MDNSNHGSHNLIREEDINIDSPDREQHRLSPEVSEIMTEIQEQTSSEEDSVVSVDDESQHLQSDVLYKYAQRSFLSSIAGLMVILHANT
jgi:hypothetical protein